MVEDPGTAGVQTADERRRFFRLGILTLLVYVAFHFYPQRGHGLHRLARELSAWFGVGALACLYIRGARLVPRSTRVLIGFFLLFATAAIFVWPFDSSDLYAYAQYGWLQTHYGANPYVTLPPQIAGWRHDPMFTTTWAHTPCVYGFLFSEEAALVAKLGGGNLQLTFLYFKLLNVVAYGLVALLCVRIAQKLALPDPHKLLYLLLFCPLLLLHHIANGHNDLWMTVFLLLAIDCSLRGAWVLVFPALAAAILFKYVAAVAGPFLLLHEVRRRGWGRPVLGMALGALVAAAIAAPYLPDWRSYRFHEISAALASPRGSVQAFFVSIYGDLLHRVLPPGAPTVARIASLVNAFFLAGYLYFFLRWFLAAANQKSAGGTALVSDILVALLVLLCLTSAKLYPWYLAIFFPLALLLPEGHALRDLTLLFVLFQLFGFTFIAKAHMLVTLVTVVLPIWIWRRRMRRNAPPVLAAPSAAPLPGGAGAAARL